MHGIARKLGTTVVLATHASKLLHCSPIALPLCSGVNTALVNRLTQVKPDTSI